MGCEEERGQGMEEEEEEHDLVVWSLVGGERRR